MSEKGGQDEEDKNSETPPQLSENLSEEVASMWEIPQMYQFLCLAKETLGIQHLSMYEMERMLLMPKASKQLGSIMTSLLCPPMTKSKLRSMPAMPYQFWTNLLTQRALTWFKVYQTKEGDTVKVLETIGVEPEFWKIFPQAELISERKFEKLSLRERVWLLKTVCDTLIHSRRTLQDEVVRNYLDDDNEMVLGKDRHGARYIYFPIFLNNELRIYRHCLDNKILLSLKAAKKEAKPKPEVSEKKVVKRKRKSGGWRYGKLPTKSKKKTVKSDKEKIEPREQEGVNDKKEEVKAEVELNKEVEETKEEEKGPNEERQSLEDKNAGEEPKEDEKIIENVPNTPTVDPVEGETREDPHPTEEQESHSLRDDVSNCSKTDDEKISEKRTTASPLLTKNSLEKCKSDDEKIIETASPRVNEEKGESSEKIAEEPTTLANNTEEGISEDLSHKVDDSNTPELKIDTISAASKKEIEEFKRMITDLGESSFRLVADSLDALRDLVACFMAQNYPEGPETAACEVQLIKKLHNLIRDLEGIESCLKQSKIDAKEKLQREWADFQEGVKENGSQSADGEKGSNTWILGSQGCPTLANGDTLSQFSVESPQQSTEGGIKIKIEKKELEEENENDSQTKPRRVLRARGISSYVEPFFTSSEESDHSELDGWTNYEAINPLATGEVSPPDPNPIRPRQLIEGSTADDSDQDWILPGSRKRRRKRSTPSKRNKSGHSKSQPVASHNSTTLHPASDLKPMTDSKIRLNLSNDLMNDSLDNLSNDSLNNPSNETLNNPPNNPPNNPLSIRPLNKIKITSVHSELDIKDEFQTRTNEEPIIDTITSTSDNSSSNGVQQNYVLVNTGNGPVNYVVMPQDTPQQQTTPMVSVVPPAPPQSYVQTYIQSPGGYIMPHVEPYRPPYPQSNLQSMLLQQSPQMMPQQPQMMSQQPQMMSQQPQMMHQQPQMMPQQPYMPNNYVYQPMMPSMTVYPGSMQAPVVTQSVAGPRQPTRDIQIRPVGQNQPRPQHPVGAVIRSASVPFRGAPRPPARGRGVPNNRITIGTPRPPRPPMRQNPGPLINRTPPTQSKTTSLIVLSDSDDEIEMIVTEKGNSTMKNAQQRAQVIRQKPVITSEVVVPNKSVLSPQIIQRMNQGGISITPIKPKSPERTTISGGGGGTQLVVVVNETGSHYALALPNGSKLILTPEQVAQIRASNGGKLVL